MNVLNEPRHAPQSGLIRLPQVVGQQDKRLAYRIAAQAARFEENGRRLDALYQDSAATCSGP